MAKFVSPQEASGIPLPCDNTCDNNVLKSMPSTLSERRERNRPNVSLAFKLAPIVVSLVASLALLSSCLLELPKQPTEWESPSYKEFCSGARSSAAEHAQRFSAFLADHVRYEDLRSDALNAWGIVWGSVSQAASTARTAAGPLVAVAKRHAAYTSEYLQRASFERAYQGVVSHIGALLDNVSARFASLRAQPTGAQAPNTPVPFTDFLDLLDQTSVRPEYVRNLWDQAAAGGASPQKAALWLLTCRVEDECSAAANTLAAADKTNFRIDGPTFGHPNDAGELQHMLLTFLYRHPGSLVIVTQPEGLHTNSLKVLANAVSESGQLQLSGRPAPSKRTMFVFMAKCDQAGVCTDKGAVASGWRAQSFSAQAHDAVYASAVVLGFRRQVDAVLPLRTLPSVLSDGSDAPSASASTDFWHGAIGQRSMQAYHMMGELLGNLMRKRKAKA